ncbi:MAG: GNAT family N-acetyltransferase [Gammaproteobacteria bacterium]|nr:MAG: GNAT family N-acetyltransferase [Gammaproteobacteria bacterium]
MTGEHPPTPLRRRVEEASLNAWPALQQMLLDGWVVRFSGGFTKRANSVIPLYPALQEPLDKIRYCERLYEQQQLKTIFRLTTVDDFSELDAQLDARGYQRIDPTRVLHRIIANPPQPDPRFMEVPLREWLNVYSDLAEMPRPTQALHSALLKGIRSLCIYGVQYADHQPVACGLAVVERELTGLFDVVTHPQRRRLGHAGALVSSLLGAGAQAGATHAYLQVEENNAPARAMYQALGFTDLYHYWYRAAP